MELILKQTCCGEFKSDLIVLGGVLNDALGRVGLGCVVRLPVTPVLLPGLRHFSGQSQGKMIDASPLLIVVTSASFDRQSLQVVK